jgi:hypothetical protein
VPPWLPVRILAVTVRAPSVVESAVGVTLKLAAPLLSVVTVPVAPPVNWVGDVTDQYNEVPVETLVVAILKVPEEPSFILVGAVRVYVGVEVVVSQVTSLFAPILVPKGLVLIDDHNQVLIVPDTLELAALRAKLVPAIFKVSKTVAEGAEELPFIDT